MNEEQNDDRCQIDQGYTVKKGYKMGNRLEMTLPNNHITCSFQPFLEAQSEDINIEYNIHPAFY